LFTLYSCPKAALAASKGVLDERMITGSTNFREVRLEMVD
jgi:hypothetical protein